jgi:hypothetical protein
MMTGYQLVWDDTLTARIRRAETADLRPLAWLRASYAGDSHEIGRVDVYSHAEELPGRLWRGSAASIDAAVRLCHGQREELAGLGAGEALPLADARPPVDPWAHATLVDAS